jgi:hypothetical protein
MVRDALMCLQFFRTMMFQPHESIDQPLCVVYAVDAMSESIGAAAVALLEPHLEQPDSTLQHTAAAPVPGGTQPLVTQPLATQPLADREFPRHFVLVVDARRGSLTSEELKAKGDEVWRWWAEVAELHRRRHACAGRT